MIGSQPLHLSRHGHASHSHARMAQDPGQGQALLIRPPLGTYSYLVVIIQDFESNSIAQMHRHRGSWRRIFNDQCAWNDDDHCDDGPLKANEVKQRDNQEVR
jgi:hypothetical protein